MASFTRGFICLLRALTFLLRHARLWPLALMPWLISLVIVALLGVGGIYFYPMLREAIWAEPSGVLALFAWWAYSIALAIAVLVVLFGLFVALSATLAGPFNAQLAKATREILTELTLEPAGGFYVDVWLGIRNEVVKSVYFLLLQGGLLLLNLIPVLGSMAYAVLSWYLSSMFLAYAFVEYPIDTESWALKFGQKTKYLRSRRFGALGLGSAIGLGLLVPLANLFLPPIAVVAGAIFYEEFDRQSGLPFDQ